MKNRLVCALILWAMISHQTEAQQQLTKEQILSMSTEQLSELPLEDLMAAVETLGVSSVDELFAMIMNKSVSSASKQDENSFTSPLATTVITREELRTYGATTIEDAFRLIPGMIVTQKFNGVYDIHMRGLNNLPDNNSLLYTENNNTLLMVDGRIVQNYITGAVMMDRLPISIEDVERIEVVRGACSALYGMNAVNGVINIITEKPSADSKEVSGSFQMGNQSTAIADIAIRKSINDKWSAGLTINTQYRKRPNGQIYLTPQAGIYHANGKSELSKCLNLQGGSSNESRLAIINANSTEVAPEGGLYSLDFINNTFLRQSEINYTTYESKIYTYKLFEDYASVYDRFPDPELSRRSFGINGYVSFVPTPDIRFDLSGGYQNSFIMTNPILYNALSMACQTSKTGYVNFNANIKDLHILANYSGGPQNLYVGVPGWKVKGHNFNAQAEYDINIDNLLIRPAVAWQYLYYKDYENYYNGSKLSGLFNSHADLTTISPSLRLDYRTDNKWRFIAGLRGDKTSAPDKWNLSWQAEIAKEINDKNFVRFVYGRSYRAPNMLNTASSLEWDRTGMQAPSEMNIIGSTDADLLMTDNFELGYRFRPTPNILLDAEVFFSHSHDYGALMSSSSAYTLTPEAFYSSLANLNGQGGGMGGNRPDGEMPDGGTPPDGGEGGMGGEGSAEEMDNVSRTVSAMLRNNMGTKSNLIYKNLPYEVQQLGLSLNLDWIVSPKFIVKVNANVQQTRINKYYSYNMNASQYQQLDNARANTSSALQTLFYGYIDEGEKYLAAAMGKAYMDEFKAASGYDSWDIDKQIDFWDALYEAYNNLADGETTASVPYDGGVYEGMPLALYYGLIWNVHQTTKKDGTIRYEVGETAEGEPELINKHKHEATPSVYGMVGFIYKPIPKLTISTYANYMHHRTYNTTYSNVLEQTAKGVLYWTDWDMTAEEAIEYGYTTNEEVQILTAMSDQLNTIAKKVSKLHSKLSLNLKVGYKPADNLEFFVNAQNLFNDNTQEAIFSDKIGGLYTVGVNFEF